MNHLFPLKRFPLSGHLKQSLSTTGLNKCSWKRNGNGQVEMRLWSQAPPPVAAEQLQLFQLFQPFSFHRSSPKNAQHIFPFTGLNCPTPAMPAEWITPNHLPVWCTHVRSLIRMVLALEEQSDYWSHRGIARSTYSSVWGCTRGYYLLKVSCSYQVYHMETRAIQWFSAHWKKTHTLLWDF